MVAVMQVSQDCRRCSSMPSLGDLSEHKENGPAAGQEGCGFIRSLHGQMSIGETKPAVLQKSLPLWRRFPNSIPLA